MQGLHHEAQKSMTDDLPREVGEPQRLAAEVLDLEGLHRDADGLPVVHERGRRLGETPRAGRRARQRSSDEGSRAHGVLPGWTLRLP